MSKKPERATFMSRAHKEQLAGIPRSHYNCKAYTGVMRPGKTAKDHYGRPRPEEDN